MYVTFVFKKIKVNYLGQKFSCNNLFIFFLILALTYQKSVQKQLHTDNEVR